VRILAYSEVQRVAAVAEALRKSEKATRNQWVACGGMWHVACGMWHVAACGSMWYCVTVACREAGAMACHDRWRGVTNCRTGQLCTWLVKSHVDVRLYSATPYRVRMNL